MTISVLFPDLFSAKLFSEYSQSRITPKWSNFVLATQTVRGVKPLNILSKFTSAAVERGGNSVDKLSCLKKRQVAQTHPVTCFILILQFKENSCRVI